MSNDHLPEDSNLQNNKYSYITPIPQHSESGEAVKASEGAASELFQSTPSQPDSEKMWSKLEEILQKNQTLQRKLVQEEIFEWKREQQLAKNGWKQFTKNLNDIQNSCEELLDSHIALHNDLELLYQRQQSQRILPADSYTDSYHVLKSRALELLGEFLNATLVIESQPLQVIRTNSRITFQVRHLLGQKLYSHSRNNSVVATLINESTARELVQGRYENRRYDFQNSPGILSNEFVEMEIVGGKYVGNFQNLQLKRFRRSSGYKTNSLIRQEGVPEETVCSTDEKLCFIFQTVIQYCAIDFNVWDLSYPVLVIPGMSSHSMSRIQGFIFWDNAFGCMTDPTNCLPERIPFQVPAKVPWESLGEMLSAKFEQATGKRLEAFQLEALKCKLVSGKSSPDNPDCGDTSEVSDAVHEVSFNQFAISKLSGYSFSFWKWFYVIMKLVEKHASAEWRSGAIPYVFVSRQDAGALLQESSPGVFIVTFTDTLLGRISITFVNRNGQVQSTLPWTNMDLSTRNLSDRIWDDENLTHVYPDVPKSNVFPQSRD